MNKTSPENQKREKGKGKKEEKKRGGGTAKTHCTQDETLVYLSKEPALWLGAVRGGVVLLPTRV